MANVSVLINSKINHIFGRSLVSIYTAWLMILSAFVVLSITPVPAESEVQVCPSILQAEDSNTQSTTVASTVSCLLALAKDGDNNAQYLLGEAYRKGIEVKKDLAQALHWFQKAAMEGHVEGSYASGFAHYYGIGTQRNDTIATTFLQRAATEGHSNAQKLLGDLLYNLQTSDINVNVSIALDWYKRAATAGHLYAQLALGDHYLTSHPMQALRWYNLAANQDYGPVQTRLGFIFEHGLNGTIPADIGRAIYWYQRASTVGHFPTITDNPNRWDLDTTAPLALYDIYLNGSGVTQDLSEAAKWLTRVAQKGHRHSLFLLANMYMNGVGVERDPELAIEYYELAADAGSGISILTLGRIWSEGLGVKPNVGKAIGWFMRAAKASSHYSDEVRQFAALRLLDLYEKNIRFQGDSRRLYEALLMPFDRWRLLSRTRDELHAFSSFIFHDLNDSFFDEGFSLNSHVIADELWEHFFSLSMSKLHGKNSSIENISDIANIYNIAWMYDIGLGLDQDSEKAFFHYSQLIKAIEQRPEILERSVVSQSEVRFGGYTDLFQFRDLLTAALERVSHMYGTGAGVEIDEALANDYEQRALRIKMGDPDASVRYSPGMLLEYARKYEGEDDSRSEEFYHQAFIAYEKEAEEGMIEAECMVAWMHYYGLGVQRDYSTAFRWAEKVAGRQGSDKCYYDNLYRLGWMFANGVGTAQSGSKANLYFGRASRFFREKAKAGDPIFQYRLGVMHLNGWGVEKSYATAGDFFESAADAGHAEAAYRLGLLHYKGRGRQPSRREAARWFRRAIFGDHSMAMCELAWMHLRGEGVRRDPDKAKDLFLASRRGREPNQVCDAGIALTSPGLLVSDEAECLAGRYELLGQQGAKKNIASAMERFTLLARNGNACGQFHLAREKMKLGTGRSSYGDGIDLLRKAAEQGYEPAQFDLAMALLRDDGEEAAIWFRKLAIGGSSRALRGVAQFNLGEIYFSGHDVRHDYIEALYWFLRSAEQGYQDADNRIELVKEGGRWIGQYYFTIFGGHRKLEYAYALERLYIDSLFGRNGIDGTTSELEESRSGYFRLAQQYGALDVFRNMQAKEDRRTSGCVPLVVLYGGAWDRDRPGYYDDGVLARIKNDIMEVFGPQGVEVQYYSSVGGLFDLRISEDSEIEIRKHKSEYPNSPVAIIGHSWGADHALKVVQQLQMPVDFLFTLDGVHYASYVRSGLRVIVRKGPWLGNLDRPRNLMNWYNVYADKDALDFGNLIAYLGGAFNSQKEADQNILYSGNHEDAYQQLMLVFEQLDGVLSCDL